MTVSGAHNPSSKDNWVRLDAMIVGAKKVVTPRVAATWPQGVNYAGSGVKGAIADLFFRGTGVVWHALGGPYEGRAKVSIDGGTPVIKDLYRGDVRAEDLRVQRTGRHRPHHRDHGARHPQSESRIQLGDRHVVHGQVAAPPIRDAAQASRTRAVARCAASPVVFESAHTGREKG